MGHYQKKPRNQGNKVTVVTMFCMEQTMGNLITMTVDSSSLGITIMAKQSHHNKDKKYIQGGVSNERSNSTRHRQGNQT